MVYSAAFRACFSKPVQMISDYLIFGGLLLFFLFQMARYKRKKELSLARAIFWIFFLLVCSVALEGVFGLVFDYQASVALPQIRN